MARDDHGKRISAFLKYVGPLEQIAKAEAIWTFYAAYHNTNRVSSLYNSAYAGRTAALRLLSQREFQAALETQYCGGTLYKTGLSRERALRVGNVLQNETLIQLAQSDVYWDQITSIEPDGEEEVYDLSVPGLHNFIANNIIVHNSLEQDADIVMFIYRDECTTRTPSPQIADI
jgi:replicative DNA helicase